MPSQPRQDKTNNQNFNIENGRTGLRGGGSTGYYITSATGYATSDKSLLRNMGVKALTVAKSPGKRLYSIAQLVMTRSGIY